MPGTDQRSRNLIVLVPLALSLGLASCVTPTATWQRQVSAGGCLSYPAYVPAGSGYYSQGSSGQSAPRRLERICRVSYAKEYGWSTEYTMGVEFLTGAQLNSATGSYSYNSYDCYALLWFGKGEVAILRHTGLAVGAGWTFDEDDFDRMFPMGMSSEFVQVNGDEGRRWRIRPAN